ncbi:MAG: zinc-ribbon domain-containing protein [Candidatus Hodarchaeota archaeon]
MNESDVTYTCTNCGKDSPPDAKFCLYCGTKIKFCINCRKKISVINRYCPECGAPQPQLQLQKPATPIRSPYYPVIPRESRRSFLWSILGIICFASFASFGLIIIVNALFIIPSLILSLFALESGTLPLYFIPDKITVQGLELLVFAVITFSILIASIILLFAQDWRKLNEAIRHALSNLKNPLFFNTRPENRPKSTFVLVTQLYVVTFFFNILMIPFILLEELSTMFQGSLQLGDIQEIIFELTVASVWEEVFFRIICVGVPLLILKIIFVLYHQMMNPEQTENLKIRPVDYILGGYQKGRLTIPEVIFIIIASFLFGWAHIIGGWGLWKMVPTFVVGLAFGYLFLTRGIHAAILLHFAFDGLGAVVLFFGALIFSGNPTAVLLAIIPLLLLEILIFVGYITWFISGAWITANYSIGIIDFGKNTIEQMKSPNPVNPANIIEEA